MTSAQVQIWAQRRTTRLLINAEPTLIVLRRAGTWVLTPGGGQTRSGPSQTFPAVSRFFTTVELHERFTATINGVVIVGDHVLVGMPDDNMKAMDEFEIGDKRFRILYVHSNRDFECRAECKEMSQASG